MLLEIATCDVSCCLHISWVSRYDLDDARKTVIEPWIVCTLVVIFFSIGPILLLLSQRLQMYREDRTSHGLQH